MRDDASLTIRRFARWALPALGACAAYAVWNRLGRSLPEEPAAPTAYPLRSCGEDTERGNLLGIQPWLATTDYASSDRLFTRLDGYFTAARQAGVLDEKTVVILPEHLGTWLAAAREKAAVYRAGTVSDAVRLMILSNLPAFLARLPRAREREWAMATAVRMKAAATASRYHRVMSALARRYGVYLVAGSLLLPEPYVRHGALRAGCGPLYNVSPLYGPDGLIREPLTRKVYPAGDELPLLAAGHPGMLPVFPTPAGRLGILICADTWYPDCYAVLRAREVELIAAPSFAAEEGGMGRSWEGYSGAPPPADVNLADVGRLTRGAAWRKYALASRLVLSGARAGMNVFLQGTLWEMHPAGPACAVRDGCVVEYEEAALVNLWL